jgi:hypothetical protein
MTDTKYLDSIKNYADIIAIDYYPLDVDGNGTPGPKCDEADMNKFISAGYMWTKANGKKWGLVLQAYSPSVCYHNGEDRSTWPTQAQMQKWRNIGMQNSRPEWIIWYSYFDIMWKNPQFISTVRSASFATPFPRMPN